MDTPKILVTGATGFIGSALISALKSAGYFVRATSRHVGEMSDVEWRVLPCDGMLCDWAGAADGIDTIVHLAGLAHFHWKAEGVGVIGRIKKSEIALALETANILNARLLAQEARRAGVRRVIFLSSIGAVASHSPSAISESTIPFPDTDYGRSKLMAELVLREELDRSDIELVIIRPPLVYGPRNVANMFRLIRWVESGLPIPLKSIRNRRSLVYIDNLVSLILVCIHSSEATGLPLLVSDGEDLSTPELIRRIAKVTDSPCRLIPFPKSILLAMDFIFGIDVFRKLCGDLFVDSSGTFERVGWRPLIGVDEGLRRTVARENLAIHTNGLAWQK